MTPGKHTVDGQVLVKERKDLSSTRSCTPVTHEIAYNCEEADKLDASLLHAGVGGVADELRGGTGTFDVGKDGITLGAQRKSKEGCADVGDNTGDDDLLLAGGFYGGAEFGVVPGAN